MRYMANSRLAEGVTPERLNEYIDNNGISSSAWELVRHRVVTDYAFKVGDAPGIVLFLEVDSMEAASDLGERAAGCAAGFDHVRPRSARDRHARVSIRRASAWVVRKYG